MFHIRSGPANCLSARIWLVACFAFLLSACSLIRDQVDPTTVSIRGVPPTLEQLNISTTAYAQNLMVDELIQTAGLPPATQLMPYDDNWSLVMKAGIYEIGRQCDQYLDVLFRFNREQRAGRQDLAAAAAATGAIMGLSGASAKALAITAAAFGLATSLFDASVNSVLFTIDPSALRNVALQGRRNYLEQLKNLKINTRPDMLIALQGYLTQCSPAAIEANINNAASGAPSVVTPSPDNSTARNAAALAAPGTALLREERAKEVVSRPVTTAPAQMPERLTPPNLQRGEEHFTTPEIKGAQAALGIPVNGDLGPPGSATREAITEFQKGMHLRAPDLWPTSEITGVLTSRTGRTLPLLSPMPRAIFSSPFERAFLGDSSGGLKAQLSRPDPGILDHVLQLLGVSATELPQGNSPEAIDAKIKLMHEKVSAFRREKGIDPRKGAALDSGLYDVLSRQEGPIGPGR
jgi:hypothetical protein